MDDNRGQVWLYMSSANVLKLELALSQRKKTCDIDYLNDESDSHLYRSTATVDFRNMTQTSWAEGERVQKVRRIEMTWHDIHPWNGAVPDRPPPPPPPVKAPPMYPLGPRIVKAPPDNIGAYPRIARYPLMRRADIARLASLIEEPSPDEVTSQDGVTSPASNEEPSSASGSQPTQSQGPKRYGWGWAEW